MTYRSTILADVPSHYWPLAEPGGTVVSDIIDPAGTGLSLAGSVGYRGITSTDGSALINNSANNAFIGLRSKQYAVSPFTLEAWVYLWGYLGTYMDVLMFGGATASADLIVQPTGQLTLQFRGAGLPGVFSSVGLVPLNQWVHLVASVGSLTTWLYINGVLDSSGTPTHNLPASGPFGIGGESDRTQPVNGYVASPAIYTVALGAPAVLAHYNAAEQKGEAPVFVGGASAQAIAALQVDLARIIADVERTW